MLNVNLSYNPTSYWRMMFRSGGLPRKFICLKKFRDLVVPSGGCRKGIIVQGRQIKRRFPCGNPVMPKNKRVCNGRIYPYTQT